MAEETTSEPRAGGRRPAWRWIAAGLALVAVAAAVWLVLAGSPGGDDAAGDAEKGFAFAHPEGWSASELRDAPRANGAGWLFDRSGERDYATLTVVPRALPGDLSVRGYARQHGAEAMPRDVAGHAAWQISVLALGVFERAVFVPVPGDESVIEVRLVTGPVDDWEGKAAADVASARAEDMAALEDVLGSLEFAR